MLDAQIFAYSPGRSWTPRFLTFRPAVSFPTSSVLAPRTEEWVLLPDHSSLDVDTPGVKILFTLFAFDHHPILGLAAYAEDFFIVLGGAFIT